MATVYGKSSWPVPAAGDLSSGPGIVQNVATALDSFVIPKYASAAAQTTANPSPADGDRWYRTDTHQGWINRATVGPVPEGDSCYFIGSVILGTTATSFAFSSIPQTYRHLVMYITSQSVYPSAITANLNFTFNGDTGANYSSATYYSAGNGSPQGLSNNAATSIWGGISWTTAGGANTMPGRNIIWIPDYLNTNWYKGLISSMEAYDGVTTNGWFSGRGGGGWHNTAAINAIQVTDATGFALSVGTTASLYGMGS